jgi:hypothetical protein
VIDPELKGFQQEYGSAENVVLFSQAEHSCQTPPWVKPLQETLRGLLEVYNCINVQNVVHWLTSKDTRNQNVLAAGTGFFSRRSLL